MILYDYFRSSASFRVRIALNLKGLAPERRFIHLRRGEQRADPYLVTNPHGLVPALDLGDLVLTQSLAIIEYLDETHPTPPLLPADALGRARVRALAQSIACDIHPINNLRVLNYLGDWLHEGKAAVAAWYNHWIATGFAALERQAAASGSAFLYGDRPTLADICLVPQVVNARRFDLPLAPYPHLMRIYETCMAIPEFHDAKPDLQPDAEP